MKMERNKDITKLYKSAICIEEFGLAYAMCGHNISKKRDAALIKAIESLDKSLQDKRDKASRFVY